MKHECKITVLETKCFPELQKQYLAGHFQDRAHRHPGE